MRIAIDKPSGVSGRTLTIDASVLEVEPGLHGTGMTLSLELRSSRGTEHRIVLPAGAEVSSVRRDEQAQPIRQEGRELVLSVPAGKHIVAVVWRQPTGIGAFFRTPAVDLRVPSTNSQVNLGLPPAARWLLWLDGPAVGPVVGFWAVVALLVLASILLARTRLTPLRTHQWLLLGLGLTQITPVAALVVVVCLLGLGWRARRTPSDARPVLYNAGQLALALLMVLSLYAIASVVEARLGQPPEMFVSGNASMPSHLLWYQDRSAPVLAQPALLSLPVWVYRGLVMAWALWLAVAIIRWLPWIGSCLKRHGLWRASTPLAWP